MNRFLTVSQLLLALFFVSTGTTIRAEEYRLSMLPRYFPERLTAMLTPLTGYLRERTGEDIQMVLTKNFRDYEQRVKSGEIAIAYQNPLVYVNVSATQEVVAMALKGQEGDRFRGIVITRPDSGITSLADLRGKLVMIVGETSAGGYLSQKLSLLEQGIDIGSLSFEEAAENRQENVIIAVSVAAVDAGFIRESALHKADRYIIPGSVTTIAKTAWLPNWAFSLDRTLDPALRTKVRDAVLALKPGDPVLQALGLTGFRSAADGDYDVMRKLVASP